ncbi:MAG: hypothetical protein N2C14_13600 [Planctomycetales bacterium]
MNITFECPQCEQASRQELNDSAEVLSCDHCEHRIQLPQGAIDGDAVQRCLACPSEELFLRKDFPQQLGVAIVTVGLTLSCVSWWYYSMTWTYALLFGTAMFDLILYFFMRDALICYRCGAEYRGGTPTNEQGPFNLETHERYRQQAARESEAARESAAGSSDRLASE